IHDSFYYYFILTILTAIFSSCFSFIVNASICSSRMFLTFALQIPQDPPQPLGTHAQGKRKRSVTRGKSESRGADTKALLGAGAGVGEVYNPEEGWDDDTDPTGVVLDHITKEEVSRRASFSPPVPSSFNNPC